jgi:Glycosyl transferase family 2
VGSKLTTLKQIIMQSTHFPVTVLMPVFNAEKYLFAAIDSILNQSYTQFELLIINDGSTDASGEIIASYRDNRVRCVTNEANLNLCRSLSKGVSLARGEFIARMDADDIAHPERLEKQLAIMRACPDLNLLGTNVRWIDQNANVVGHSQGISDPVDLRWNMFFRNCFNHPTVMIRKSALERSGLNYGVIPDAIAAYLPERLGGIGDEDYLLFGLLCLHGKVGNLDEVLLDYRIHGESLTALFPEKQNEQTERIASALRAIYTQHCDNRGSISNGSRVPIIDVGLPTESRQINAIAQKMLHEFPYPAAQRRIETQCRLQCALSVQGQQNLLRRVLVGLSFFLSLAPLRKTDFPLLLKYVFGAKLASIYRRHLRLRRM